MITHSYCKGDKLVPDTYNQLSIMPCRFESSWPLTMEVLRFSDAPDLRVMAPEACEYVEQAHAAWEICP